jgi:hypothetical protein
MFSLHQKSAYLIILNATMILRSIGTTFKHNNDGKTLKEYKICLFKILCEIFNLIESNEFNENVLRNSIIELANQFSISIGQSQKPINVILKFHYYLNNINNNDIKKQLDCPIDKIILKELGFTNLSLNAIDLEQYNKLQKIINERVQFRIDFDDIWDRQHLEAEGLL